MELTRSQKAFNLKNTSILKELARPFNDCEMGALVEDLKTAKPDTLWGAAICHTFKENGDIPALVDALASQAIDDYVTMAEIVGFNATLLLLRYYDTKNPQKNESQKQTIG